MRFPGVEMQKIQPSPLSGGFLYFRCKYKETRRLQRAAPQIAAGISLLGIRHHMGSMLGSIYDEVSSAAGMYLRCTSANFQMQT